VQDDDRFAWRCRFADKELDQAEELARLVDALPEEEPMMA